MIDALWNIIPNKIKLGLILLIIIVIGGVFYYQYSKINLLEENLVSCHIQMVSNKTFYDGEILKAKTVIAIQNNATSQFEIDSNSYTQTVKQKNQTITNNLIESQREIESQLTRNSTTDNQLKLIESILGKFSDGN